MPKKKGEKPSQLELRFETPSPQAVPASPRSASRSKIQNRKEISSTSEGPEAPKKLTRFERRFHAVTRWHWDILFTRNKSIMISYRTEIRPPLLRIHEMFKDASHDVTEAVARIVEGKGRVWPRVVNEYIRRHMPEYEDQRPARRVTLETQGRHVDLTPLFNRLNADYFDGSINARLGWMTPRLQRRVSIKLGSYSEETNVIRIHPALDHPDVPLRVVEAVLFHEMVHAQVKSTEVDGRRISHGEDFQRELERYPHTEFADDWIKRHLGLLLPQSRRRSPPTPGRTR